MSIGRAQAAAKAVDDAVISVHRKTSSTYGEQIRSDLRDLGLASPALLVDVAEFLLADALSPHTLTLRYRYQDPVDIAAVLRTWEQAGLVDTEPTAGNLRASAGLREFLETVLTIRAEVAERLWRDRIDSLLLIATGARAVVEASEGSLAVQFSALPEPHQPALLTHHVLTGLRYHRADAHAAAWQSSGLDRQEIIALTKAWQGHTIEPPSSLIRQGWFDGTGVTKAGLDARDWIETSTNELAEPSFATISDHTWPDWLHSLKALAASAQP